MSIKKAREESGLSQQDLAERLGVDQSAVCLWETGKTQPRAKLLPRIAEILHCSIDFLLTSNTDPSVQ